MCAREEILIRPKKDTRQERMPKNHVCKSIRIWMGIFEVSPLIQAIFFFSSFFFFFFSQRCSSKVCMNIQDTAITMVQSCIDSLSSLFPAKKKKAKSKLSGIIFLLFFYFFFFFFSLAPSFIS